MNKSSKPNLSSTTIENKPLKLIINIGPHRLCIIDKSIVEKLKIDGGDICEQKITEEGDIILKIKKFLVGGQNASIQ